MRMWQVSQQLLNWLLLILLVLSGYTMVGQQTSTETPQAYVEQFIQAVQTGDRNLAVKNGTELWKSILTGEVFEKVCKRYALAFKRPHSISFLGEVRQQGVRRFLYKLQFEQGADDLLITLTLSMDKASVVGVLMN
jgi:hypothetical protein